ncbi:hypothetical protein AAAC51_20600 [Priestia megaterium]
MALFDERILEKERPILKEKRQVHPFSLMKRNWINRLLVQRKESFFSVTTFKGQKGKREATGGKEKCG